MAIKLRLESQSRHKIDLNIYIFWKPAVYSDPFLKSPCGNFLAWACCISSDSLHLWAIRMTQQGTTKKEKRFLIDNFLVLSHLILFTMGIIYRRRRKKAMLNFSNLASCEDAWGRCGSVQEGRGKCAEKTRQRVWKGLMRQWVIKKMTTSLQIKKDNCWSSVCTENNIRRTTQIGLAALMFPSPGENFVPCMCCTVNREQTHVNKLQTNGRA